MTRTTPRLCILIATILCFTLPCSAANPPLGPASRPALSPGLQWIARERIRGSLFHQPIVHLQPTTLLQPAPAQVLTSAQTRGPADSDPGIVLRGEHYLILLIDKEKVVRFHLQNLRASQLSPMSDYALFAPDGRALVSGQVEPGKTAVIETPTAGPGPHILLLNSGIASANVTRVTVAHVPWAVQSVQRRAYLGTPLVYHFLDELKTAGFNLAMLDFGPLDQEFVTDQGLSRWTQIVQAWADEARRYGIRFMPAFNLGGSVQEVESWGDAAKGMYPKTVTGKPLAPCPLQRVWWERIFLRRAKEVACLSQHNSWIVGVGIDPEMYRCSEYGHYTASGTCYCDHCLGGFLSHQGLDTGTLRELPDGHSRQQWLKKLNLATAYDAYLADEMAHLAASLRDELHAINPNFLICVYVLDGGNWFCRGLSRGFSTPDVPVVNFSEETYYGLGYEPHYIQRTMSAFKNWGANVTAAYALWDIYFPPTRPGYLAAHSYNLATRADGYWFWPGCDLLKGTIDDSRWSYQGKLPEMSDYWLALKDANDQIQRWLINGPQYVSPLDHWRPIPWQEPGYDEKVQKWKNADLVKGVTDRLYPIHIAESCSLQFFLPPGAGAFTIQARSDGAAGSLKLFSPDGNLVVQKACPPGQPISLIVGKDLASKSGCWTLDVATSSPGVMNLDMDHTLPPYLSVAGGAALAPLMKDGDLLARWSFDEGHGAIAADTAPSPAYDGQIDSATFVPGLRGHALSFDGKHSHVRIGHNWDFDHLDQFSLSAWVNLRSLPSTGHGATIVCKGPEDAVPHFWWWIGYDHQLLLEVGSEKYPYGTEFETERLSWQPGRWYHLAVTSHCDGHSTTVCLYRDGQRLCCDTKAEPFHVGAYDFFIGAYHGGSAHGLDGLIDEVALFRRALSPKEIANLAQR